MTRLALALAIAFVLARPAQAAELTLSVGRYAAGARGDLGIAEGSLVQVGLAGSRQPGSEVELALEGRLGRAAAEPSPLAVGFTGLSLRYTRFIAAQSPTQPFVGVGFDFGSDARAGQTPVFETPSLAGHLFAGLRVPLARRVAALVTVLAGLDAAGAPMAAVSVGAAWEVDL